MSGHSSAPAQENVFFWEEVEERHVIAKAFLISLALHLLAFPIGGLLFHDRQRPHAAEIEVDITNMGPVGVPGPVQKASKSFPTAPFEQKKEPVPILMKSIEPRAMSDESPPPPSLMAQSSSLISSEFGVGTGDTKSTVLSRIPQLINLSDLRAILKRYYPEEARSQGREATVVLDIHINTEGHVTSVDIIRSGGTDFDEAAQKAAKLLRFTPAFLGSQRVNVKMRQAIQFKLEQ